MVPTTLPKFHHFTFFILAAVALCLVPSMALAQPQIPADLVIENFSTYSTLPEANGFRRVSICFAVVNRGRRVALASGARVTIDNSGASFAIPSLAPGASAFVTRALRTSAETLEIAVLVDAFNNLPGENKNNNELKQTANLKLDANRWISIGPSKILDAGKTFGPVFGVGRVTTIAVDPRSPLTLYLGARGSGIWKRMGSLWFP